MAHIVCNTHNELRSDVSPPASNMMKMTWDDELADLALVQAKRCSPKHTKVSGIILIMYKAWVSLIQVSPELQGQYI